MSKKCIHPVNTESPDEIIKSLLRREGDTAGINFLKYRSVVLDLWRDMNLHTVKFVKRYLIGVNKNTNSLDLPEEFLFPSSFSVLDECNKFQSMTVNNHLHDDIVDISADKNCHCECGCKGTLCGQIKTYESIIEETQELMPDDTTKTFTSVTRKRTDADGKFYIERTMPVRIYEDGDWVDVVLKTESEELCQLEVSDCGCVKDTKDNECKVNAHCNANTFAEECGLTFCNPQSKLQFNYSEQGNRIVMPSNFDYDKVMVRCFVELPITELRVPLVAKKAFMIGLKSYTLPYDKNEPQWRIRDFERRFIDANAELYSLLNRYSLKQVMQVLNPHRVMP
jgi:hypothetical protein